MEWLWHLLVSAALGAVAGFVAGKIMKDEGGLLRNIVLGVLGGFVGSGLASLIGIGGGWIVNLLIAIAGACLLLWLYRKLAR